MLSYDQKKRIIEVASEHDANMFNEMMTEEMLNADEVYAFGVLIKNDDGSDETIQRLEAEGIDCEPRLGDTIADMVRPLRDLNRSQRQTGGRRRKTRRGTRKFRKPRRGSKRTSRKVRRSHRRN